MHNKRSFEIDILRFISIIGMIFTHTFRLIDTNNLLKNTTTVETYLLEFSYYIMKIEPIIAALFLFTSGYSIFKKQIPIKRIFKILIISILLSVSMDLGFYPYRLLFSSTILSAIIISYIIHHFRDKYNIKSFYLLMLVLLISFMQDYFGISLTGLNSGGGAIIPIIGFSFLGSWIRELNLNKISFNKGIFTLIIAGIISAIMSTQTLVFNIESNQPGFNLETMSWGTHLLINWNLSFFGYIFNIICTLILFFSLKFIKFKHQNFIEIISKNSLAIYIFHLTLVGFCYLFQSIFVNIYITLTAFSMILTLSLFFAKWNERKKLL